MRRLRFTLVKSHVERPILAIKGKCIELNPQANHILTTKLRIWVSHKICNLHIFQDFFGQFFATVGMLIVRWLRACTWTDKWYFQDYIKITMELICLEICQGSVFTMLKKAFQYLYFKAKYSIKVWRQICYKLYSKYMPKNISDTSHKPRPFRTMHWPC